MSTFDRTATKGQCLLSGVLVHRIYMPAWLVVFFWIRWFYCILGQEILKNLFSGPHDVCQTVTAASPSSQGLAGMREIGSDLCFLAGAFLYRVRTWPGRWQHQCQCPWWIRTQAAKGSWESLLQWVCKRKLSNLIGNLDALWETSAGVSPSRELWVQWRM